MKAEATWCHRTRSKSAAVNKRLVAHNNHDAAYPCQQAAGQRIRVLLLHHNIEPGLDHHSTPGGRVPTSPAADGVAADASHIATLIGDARLQFVNN